MTDDHPWVDRAVATPTTRVRRREPLHERPPPLAAARRRERLLVASNETGPLIDGLLSAVPDIDPSETSEWVESFDGLIDDKGGPVPGTSCST